MTIDWDLDDSRTYVRVHAFEFLEAFTYADTRPGHTDKEKRERIRIRAAEGFPAQLPNAKWWAFRIYLRKSGKRPFDIENVPKLIVDAFCEEQIRKDGSRHASLGLYPDDTIDHVRLIEIGGERTADEDSTRVEIFAFT